jgi:hypothetical protein
MNNLTFKCTDPPIMKQLNGLVASILLLSAVLFQGCATQHAYFGHDETDLSILQTGVSRAAIEKVTGPPERIEQDEEFYIAWYVYDVGYKGRLEKENAFNKITMAPVMAYGELLTLGLWGAMLEHCQEVCQKGQLEVRYDATDTMLSVRESILPESHVLLDGCLYNTTFRDMRPMCMGWRQMSGGRDTEWLFGRAAGAYCPNADLGHADAQIHIGDIYYQGIYGRKYDPVRAWVWYSLAAQGGDAQAMEQLSRVTAELTPEQLAEARQQLAEWQPGQCEKDLVLQGEQQ